MQVHPRECREQRHQGVFEKGQKEGGSKREQTTVRERI
jgi:hypothetical protein